MSRFTTLLGLIVLTLASGSARAAVIHVPGDQPTIQAGMIAANPGDEVVVAPGTYSTTIVLYNKAITVRSSDPTDPAIVAATIIDATDLPQGANGKTVVRCDTGAGPDTVLDGFTIMGGTGWHHPCHSSPPCHPLRLGGGMFIRDSSPTVKNCTFTGNTAYLGGGLAVWPNNSSPTLIGCTFIGNSAGFGGGIFILENNNMTLTDCKFIENSAFTGSSGTGGKAGGVFVNPDSDVSLVRCAFVGNESGGGIGGMDHRGVATLVSCVFIANTGGGMYHSGTLLNMTNCTFFENTGSSAPGLWMGGDHSVVHNSVFWGNVADANASEGDPFMDESAQINMSGETAVVNYSNVQGGWSGSGVNNIDADPLFVDADGADNVLGTEDDDLRLQPGSPCIDAGNNGPVTELIDLDGNTRTQGCVVDMGAYEFPQPGPITDADTDCDDDVDGVDFAQFAQCFNKSGNPPRTLGCSTWAASQLDFDDDSDIDGVDFAKFAQCFNGAANPPRTLGCPQN